MGRKQGRPTKNKKRRNNANRRRSNTSSKGNNNNKDDNSSSLQDLLPRDVWVDRIMPFVGMGNFAFIAPVNKQMKDFYLGYCKKVQNPPRYRNFDEETGEYVFSQLFIHITEHHTFYSAAVVNKKCAQFWKTCNKDVFSKHACTAAAAAGNFKLVRWAYKNGSKLRYETGYHIVRSGDMDIVEWVFSNRCPWDEETCAIAAAAGHLDVLTYLHVSGCPWDESTCDNAVSHLAILQYARRNGCPWDDLTSMWAADRGQLETLKWLNTTDVPWRDSNCTSAAASNGHLDVLKWLVNTRKCELDKDVCEAAVKYGHLEVLGFLLEKNCPWIEDAQEIAAAEGHDHIVDWLKDCGLP